MTVDLERLRASCLKLPHVTEDVQWENNLLFRVGGKMFVVVDLDPPHQFAFKCSPGEFSELTQVEGIIPAPYLARHHWVKVLDHNALKFSEVQRLINDSHRMVYEKLSQKVKVELEASERRGK